MALIACSCAALACAALGLPSARPQEARAQHLAKQDQAKQTQANSKLDPHITAFVAKHCFACHGPQKKRGGLALHIYQDEAGILKDRKRWNAVLHMVHEGEMPPQERPRPKLADSEAFQKAVGAIFERHDRTARRDPGRVTMRRLNRTEYNNTIRDLVGVDFQPADDFPTDDVGYGFDNIGDVLTVSPVLMERYLAAAEAIMARALVVGKPPAPGSRRLVARFLEPAQRRDVRTRELTADRLHAPFKVSQDGESHGMRDAALAGFDEGVARCLLTLRDHRLGLVLVAPNHEMDVFGHDRAGVAGVLVLSNYLRDDFADNRDLVIREAQNLMPQQVLRGRVELAQLLG